MALKDSKHDKFCIAWHKTGNKSEAFRQSHPHSLKWKDKTVHTKASELGINGKVSRL